MVDALYLAAAVAFIIGLKLLGAPRTARTGNRVAALGMLAAVVITLASEDIVSWATIVAGLVVGSALGAWFALKVQMTAMPQMVAAFNGFGGLASALVAAVAVVDGDVGSLPAETSVPLLVSIVVGILDPGRPSVGIDDELVARRAVQNLLALGHTRIAMIACVDPEGSHYSADISRERGYRAALADAGIEVDEDLIVSVRWGIEGGSAGMDALLTLPRLPTAVFAYSDEVAFGVLRSLRRARLRVPEDISIVGVDDHPMAESMDLTTVRQSPREQGEVAGRLCIDLLEENDTPRQAELETRLVLRRSIAPPRRP